METFCLQPDFFIYSPEKVCLLNYAEHNLQLILHPMPVMFLKKANNSRARERGTEKDRGQRNKEIYFLE